ncbi:MAG TPA: arginase family protein [Gemmataceae bacterium]|jgi:arginase family enzyme|nr:arginase family protein [Gemmataceae bacterium]
MKAQVVVFPFDQFGSAGTGAGAELLGDAVREILADAKRETQPARSDAFRDHVRVREFPFETQAQLADWRKTARNAIRTARKAGDRVLWLAGNHLAALPAYEELGSDALVIQFDAHLDVYNLADCTTELSHGNFLLHADGPLPATVNVGSRDLFLPTAHVKEHFREVFRAEDVAADSNAVVNKLLKLTRGASRIWIDLDCDAFDAAYFPAVQHPLPMGLSPAFVLRVLSAIGLDKVTGVSISEFDSGRDRADQSLGTLVWLIEWMMLRWFEP